MDRLATLFNAPVAVRRFAAFLVLLLVLAATGLTAWSIASALAGQGAEIDAKRQRLGALRSIINLGETVRQRHEAGPQTPVETMFLTGDGEAIVHANLQRRVTDMLAARNVNTLSIGDILTDRQDGVSFVGLRLAFSGTNEAVLSTLNDIETSLPPLVIRDASIRSASTPNQVESLGPGEIVARFRVYGVMQTDGAMTGERQ